MLIVQTVRYDKNDKRLLQLGTEEFEDTNFVKNLCVI